jgi:HEPN domain-containing protein
MQNMKLAEDYLRRAEVRLRVLDAYIAEKSWAEVVRESQETVELALKALLRFSHIDIPRIHDVGDALEQNRSKLPREAAERLEELCAISRDLRRDRELSFYGSEDLTPSDFYREADALKAKRSASAVVEAVRSAAPHRRPS